MKRYKTLYIHFNESKDKELIGKLLELEEKIKEETRITSISELLRALLYEAIDKVDENRLKKLIEERKYKRSNKMLADTLIRKATTVLN